jgi:hypothetical protein
LRASGCVPTRAVLPKLRAVTGRDERFGRALRRGRLRRTARCQQPRAACDRNCMLQEFAPLHVPSRLRCSDDGCVGERVSITSGVMDPTAAGDIRHLRGLTPMTAAGGRASLQSGSHDFRRVHENRTLAAPMARL